MERPPTNDAFRFLSGIDLLCCGAIQKFEGINIDEDINSNKPTS
jgi:hypothetical protein